MTSLASAVPDRIGEGAERLGHAGPGLRGREELRCAVDGTHSAELFLAHDEPLRQVHLVPEEHHRDVAREMLLAGHRGRRHHGPPIERGLMYRADASIAPDNSYSSGRTFRAYRSFATRSARDWNAFSTLTPAFADVKWNGLS